MARDESHVYVALLANGFVKVGMSKDPWRRLCGLDAYFRREVKAGIERWSTNHYDLTRWDATVVERKTLARLAELGAVRVKGRELFRGVSYNLAAAIRDHFAQAPARPV
jgi:hypothetical protein